MFPAAQLARMLSITMPFPICEQRPWCPGAKPPTQAHQASHQWAKHLLTQAVVGAGCRGSER